MKLELGYVNRRRWSWTQKRQQQADDVIEIVEALADYQPLTLREMTVAAIESYLDMDLFWEQKDIESAERQKMAELQERFLAEAKAVLGNV